MTLDHVVAQYRWETKFRYRYKKEPKWLIWRTKLFDKLGRVCSKCLETKTDSELRLRMPGYILSMLEYKSLNIHDLSDKLSAVCLHCI